MGAREAFGKDAARGHAVFQRKTRPRGRLRPVAQHEPAAIRGAADLEGQHMQEIAAARGDADHRAQPLPRARDQLGGQMALADQPPGAVKIGHHRFQQIRALRQPGADRLPFRFMQDHRNMRKRPFAFRQRVIRILPEEDAGIAQILVGAFEPRGDLARAQPCETLDKTAPDRAHLACRIEQFIRHPGREPVMGEQVIRGMRVGRGRLGHGAPGLEPHSSPMGRRRSRVSGNSGCGASGAGT